MNIETAIKNLNDIRDRLYSIVTAKDWDLYCQSLKTVLDNLENKDKDNEPI